MPRNVIPILSLLSIVTIANAQEVMAIKSIKFTGTGCKANDSSMALYTLNDAGLPSQFALIFSNYIAEQGPGISPSKRKRDCDISIKLSLPQGYQFNIMDVRFAGYADLPAGVNGAQTTTYQFPQLSNSAVGSTLLQGAFQGNYERSDSLIRMGTIWSPCNKNVPLHIRTQVSLNGNNTSEAFLTTDQVDGKVKQIYGLQWRACR